MIGKLIAKAVVEVVGEVVALPGDVLAEMGKAIAGEKDCPRCKGAGCRSCNFAGTVQR